MTSWHLSCAHPALMIFPISLGYWVFSSKCFTSGEGGVACHCRAAVTVLLRDVAECPPQSSHQVTLFCILCPCTLGEGGVLPPLSGERGIYLPKCRVAESGWECCQCLLSPILFYVAIDFCQYDSFYTWLATQYHLVLMLRWSWHGYLQPFHVLLCALNVAPFL